MAKLAFYTFGLLEEAHAHPHSKGFVDRVPFVFESAEQSEGFVDRAGSRYLESRDSRWGDPQASPRFTAQQSEARQDNPSKVSSSNQEAATLSLWDDLESVYAFAYYGRHAEALKQRQDWFSKPEWPNYVAWWVEDGQTPTREDASERLERLHDECSRPYAFDFKTPFDSAEQPWRMDRSKIQEKSQRVKMFDENNPTGV